MSRRFFMGCVRRKSTLCSPSKPTTLTLLDARTSVGENLALLLKQNPLLCELRLYDENGDTADMANDLTDIDTATRVLAFDQKHLKDAIDGTQIVISTGGCKEKPKESQKELFEKNIDNVRTAALYLGEFNPDAIFCIAKPPVEALVPMVSEEYKKANCYNPGKIIGITTPASIIANSLIAKHLRIDPTQVYSPIIGGLTPQTLIPVISQTRPRVQELNIHAVLQETIANAEDCLLTNNTKYCYGKAVAIYRFINLLLQAISGKSNCVDCAFVAQTGHINNFLPYMTSIVKLGPEGVISTHMPKINSLESKRLKTAAPHLLKHIRIGENHVSGLSAMTIGPKKGRACDVLLKQKMHEFQLRLRGGKPKTIVKKC